jgi:hypothetical protein
MFPTFFSRPILVSGLAAASLATLSASAAAADITSVQLGFTDSGSNLCPRIVTMKAWAHTDGPGVVNFVIRNSSGNKTGLMPATAVKGPTGNWIATLTHKFKITTDVDTKYMAEVKGSPKISNWVPLKEACLGKAPTTVGVNGPKGKYISELDKDKDQDKGKPLPQGGGNDLKPLPHGKPVGGGKPIPDTKPLAQCSDKKITATRTLAVTKTGGIGTAWTAWEHGVAKTVGYKYASSHNAKSRKETCKWKGTFTCTVSAYPCRS